jgi:hypothetical protein
MLAHFQDTEGRDVWINPIHVKVLRAKKGILGGAKKGTEIWLGWTSTSEAITVPQEPAQVAAAFNAVLAALSGKPALTIDALSASDDDEEFMGHPHGAH